MEQTQLTTRRDFVKTIAVSTAFSTFLGRSWTDVLAADVTPLATSTVGSIRMKISDWPALAQTPGSVRITLNPIRGGPPSGPTPNGQFYPIIVNRGPNNTFFALNSRCTHQACVVEAMDTSSSLHTCNCHGSVFGIDGRRVAGLAGSALSRHTITFDGVDSLKIDVAGLAYSITIAAVAAGADPVARLKLSFRCIRNLEYEVRFAETLGGPSVAVPFSTTEAGAITQEAFTSTVAADVNLFTERKPGNGFYSVVARITEV